MMHKQSTMGIIKNDLESMMIRIEDLEAHPDLTAAYNAVKLARDLMIKASAEIHQRDIRRRHSS